MNIYSYEMKSQLRTFIIWAVSILFIFTVFMTGTFNAFMSNRIAVENATSGLPPAFAAAFGIVITQLFTYGGFFTFLYTYIALIGVIMASSVSITAFSREKRSKCVDFLLAKPVSRGRIFIYKLLSAFTILVVTNVLFITVSIIAYQANGQDPGGLGKLIWASCALLFTQLVFMSFGIVFATFARKVRSVSGIATAFGFAGFILSALRSLIDEEAIRFIAPLKYFDPGAVFSGGGYEVKYVVTAAVVFIACICVSYVKFTKSDTPSV